jgi:hypothetical protein
MESSSSYRASMLQQIGQLHCMQAMGRWAQASGADISSLQSSFPEDRHEHSSASAKAA